MANSSGAGTVDYSWTEPVSASQTQYPFNNVMQTESGHFQEFDDTPGAERIRTQHKAGTFTEIQPDGSVVHKILGTNYTIVAKDNNVLIQGICNITVQGDAVLNVQGDAYEHIQGDFNKVVDGDYSILAKGDLTMSAGGDFNINNLSQTGAVYVQAGDRLVLNTDLTVHGEVLADSLHSDGSVTAGTGIHAGIPGSSNPTAGISTLGGINVGLPGPTVPGSVNALTTVIAGISVYGPLVSDLFGSMEMFRLKVDRHVHIGNRGYPTSPPSNGIMET
jgi:hypothetical protein